MFDALEYKKHTETVLDQDNIRLTIPKKIKSFNKIDNKIIIDIVSWEYSKEIMDIWFNQLNRALKPTGKKIKSKIILEFLSDDIVRIRLLKGDKISKRDYPMVLNTNKFTRPNIDINDFEDKIQIVSGNLILNLKKEPWNMVIQDADGKELYNQYTYDKHSIHELIKEQGEAQNDFSSFEVYPFGLAENLSTGEKAAFDSFRLSQKEDFYGLGEKFSRLNKKGQETLCWHFDALGTSSQKSYKNIPFFMSTKGYGIYLNTLAKSKYELGNYYFKAAQFIASDNELDFYFIKGNDLKSLLNSYTDLTGKAALPPKWTFGIWMSRNSYSSEEEIKTIANKLREEEFPCDLLHLDADWFEEPFICDYQFDKDRFPDVSKMIDSVNNLGFKMSLWQLPYVHKKSKIYNEGLENQYFEKYSDFSNQEAMIDISNKEAKTWYKNMLRPHLESGFNCIKVDFADGIEVNASYDKYHGKDMHNLYPLLYNKMIFDLTEEVHGDAEAVIWARSAYAGSQRYPIHWAGDSDSDFRSLATTLRGGLSLGLSGFSFWSHDIGGYFTTPTPECYIRWMQVGLLSSHSRFHGVTDREPWAYGEEAVKNYKKYAQLRYRLLEYLYSEARYSSSKGWPLMRALVFEFENDLNTREIDDQYMLGSALMVAPILDETNKRNIYLPSGSQWQDFWTGEIYSGGQWLSYNAPIDTIPLFKRQGKVIIYGPDMQYVGEKNITNLEVEVFHDNHERFEYFYNGEIHLIDIEEKNNLLEINIDLPLEINLKVIGLDNINKIFINKEKINYKKEGTLNYVIPKNPSKLNKPLT